MTDLIAFAPIVIILTVVFVRIHVRHRRCVRR